MHFRVALLAVALSSVGSSAWAQSSPPALPERAWLDLNVVSARSMQEEQVYAFATPLFQEIFAAATVYPAKPRATGFGLEGGFHVTPSLGVGVHLDFVNYSYPVGLGLSVPHPFFFDLDAVAGSETATPLERRDRGFDIMLAYDLPTQGDWRVRVFGGPTIFRVSQQMVDVIEYNHIFNGSGLNLVEITGFEYTEAKGTSVGFNVGGDVAYFFTRHVGVGGVLRFNRGTVTIDAEPLSGEPSELTAGHLSAGAGVRFRF